MPIYKQLKINVQTDLWVWEISESEASLEQQVQLTTSCHSKWQSLRASHHRKACLAVRCLLQRADIPLSQLYYNENGKPLLKSGVHISISHAKSYAGIALSKSQVGLDIEEHRPKIKRIAHKFINPIDEVSTESLAALTTLWCAKEATYKALSVPGVSFRSDIAISMNSNKKWLATCRDTFYDCYPIYWPEHSCVLTQKKST